MNTSKTLSSLLYLLLSISITSLAQTSPSPPMPINTAPNTPATTNVNSTIPRNELKEDYCPPSTSLSHNNDMTWTAPGGWKNSSLSFLKNIQTFIGAQWIGVTLGEVLCLYIKEGRGAFPLTLQREILAVSPTGGNWSGDKGGYKDCKSNDVVQCPFFIKVPAPPQKPSEIYEQLNFYKGQPVKDQ